MRKKQLIILTALAVVFFFVYSYLNLTPSISPYFNKTGGGQTPSSFLPLTEGEEGGGGAIFNSPDETSAYFFSRLFAETGKLSQFESFDFAAPGLIHPRSVLVNSAGYLVPGGFLGMPLVYGSLAKIVQRLSLPGRLSLDISLLIPFFTPFFAVLGVLAFYLLIRKIWGENIAFLSSVLAFFLPPFWYYSTRGMFHNVFFAVCLIFSACFFFCVPYKSPNHAEDEKIAEPRRKFWEYIRCVGGGLFLGLALITRTSEIVWLGILGLVLAIYFMFCHSERSEESQGRSVATTPDISRVAPLPRDSSSFRQVGTPQNDRWKIQWLPAILGFAVLCATFLPVLYQNQMLYGSAFKFGYNIPAVQNINQIADSPASILSPNNTEQNPAGEQAPYGAGAEQYGTHPHPTSPSLGEGEEGGGGKLQRGSAMERIFSVFRRGAAMAAPFGLHPRAVLNNFWNYFIKLFWWFTIPIIFGCLIFLYQLCRQLCHSRGSGNPGKQSFWIPHQVRNDNKNGTITKNKILYFISFLFISAWLFIYYGSWQVFDNINFQKITIGNSYLRYWLPIFIMGVPFAVLFLKNVARQLATALCGVSPKAMTCRKMAGDKPPRYACFLVSLFLCFSVFMSALTVFAGEDEGIFYVKNNLLRYNEIRLEVLKLTPPTPPYSDQGVGIGGEWGGAIIITERSDKIFFPERRIIVWKRGEALGENFKNLSKFVPLFYYNVAFTGEESKVFNKELKKMGLKIDLIKLFGNEALYKVY